MDLFQASVGIRKPDFELCSSYRHCQDFDLPVLRQRQQAATGAALHFPTAELEEAFLVTIWDIRCYLDMVEAHGKGSWRPGQQTPLATYRNVIQHRLLSIDSDPSKPHRELWRLAVLLFSSVVVYPLQNRAPMLYYMSDITRLLESGRHVDGDFRLWLLMLGGMAAENEPLQSWYVTQLKEIIGTQRRLWSDIRAVLHGFLWLDSACGEGGLELWLRVLQDS